MTDPGPGQQTRPAAAWRDPARVSVARALSLMTIGAVIGLGLAGYALFTAKGTTTFAVPPEDVALVNQTPIARADFLVALKARYNVSGREASRSQKARVLADMIREELFVQRAKELDVASVDPDVRAAMVTAVEAQAAANVITEAPDPAAVRAYYDAHRSAYSSEGRLTVQDLVFPAAAGPQLAAALSHRPKPASEELARTFGGRDTGKVSGEEFYFAAKIHLGDRLFRAAAALSDGEIADPVSLPDGVHVLYVLRNQRPVPVPFDAAYAQVLSDFRRDKIQRAQALDADFFKKRALIQIAPDLK